MWPVALCRLTTASCQPPGTPSTNCNRGSVQSLHVGKARRWNTHRASPPGRCGSSLRTSIVCELRGGCLPPNAQHTVAHSRRTEHQQAQSAAWLETTWILARDIAKAPFRGRLHPCLTQLICSHAFLLASASKYALLVELRDIRDVRVAGMPVNSQHRPILEHYCSVGISRYTPAS